MSGEIGTAVTAGAGDKTVAIMRFLPGDLVIRNGDTVTWVNQDAETPHGTQKPVECMRRPMQNNSSPGQAVYDPFLGSGTTLIAAETTGRVCLAMELDGRYVDMAVRRWQAFTGMQATLFGDGRSFDAIAAERLKSNGVESRNSRPD